MDNRYSPGQRAFLPPDRKVESWESVRPYFDELAKRKIATPVHLERWLVDRSTLLSWMEEELAWRYIRMNCDTTRKELARHYEQFITGIEPHIHRYTHLFDKKLVNSPHLARLDQKKYAVLIRAARKRMELFREKNIPLLAELQVEEQEYGKMISELTVFYRDREYTLQQAANFLRNPNREVRETVYRLIQEQRISKAFPLQDLFTRLVRKRYKIALNAGYHNFRDYQFDNLGRFDYRPEDCMQFHESVQNEVMPLVDRLFDRREEQLRLNELRPWDLDVDPDGKPPLVPASGSEELLQKTIVCFSRVREKYGSMLKQLAGRGFLDLDSRKGKAPGGFNYPLYESNVPFIFMNAAGNLRDLETLVHEGGHAIHSIMTSGLELIDFKELPAEVAELASMSMELISMEHWDVFFADESDLRRARIHQLEGIVQVLPWIAAVDHFQHWVYLNPEHQEKERLAAWNRIYRRFSSDRINWNGMEEHFVYSWQRQLHIFELPFYYIEYGMAQLGAIALWMHYKNDPENTLDRFESALRLGYTATIPEIYATAGVRFDFSPEYIRTLLEFVWKELQSLYL